MIASSSVSVAELVDRHRSEILRYLVRLLGNEQDAQDLCQETFLRAHRAWARLTPGTNARAWLYRIATNGARNALRQRARRQARTAEADLEALPAGTGATADERERLRLVAAAVQALPPRQRAALMLRQFHDMSYAEIAATVGGSAATALANVYQAIKKLRAALGGG